MLPDISNLNNNLDLFYIITSVLIIDIIVIIIARNNKLGTQINIWYNKFGISAVLLDVLIIVIGFIITRFIFTHFNITFNPTLFITVAVAVQLIHDYLFYILAIKPTNYGTNQLMDVYKNYAVENGSSILLADSLMVIGSGILAMYLKSNNLYVTSTTLITGLYILPYLLYQN